MTVPANARTAGAPLTLPSVARVRHRSREPRRASHRLTEAVAWRLSVTRCYAANSSGARHANR